MERTEKLGFLGCRNFETEIAAAFSGLMNEKLTVSTFNSTCGRPGIDLEALWNEISGAEERCSCWHLFGGACVREMKKLPGDVPSVKIHELDNCFELLLDASIVEKLIDEGAWLTNPGWLASWRERLQEWEFDVENPQTFFREKFTKIVFLDTGVDPSCQRHLEAFSSFTGLPVETLRVGLKNISNRIEILFLNWLLGQEREKGRSEFQNSDWEVQKIESELERKVRERTREIEAANRSLREKKKQLHNLAFYDPITQLPNRVLFQDRLQMALARAQRTEQQVALLFLDLDRFKLVNDSFGHNVGDQLLREVSRILSKTLRRTDTLARLGGDEFVVILEQFTGSRVPARVANKLLGVLANPILLDKTYFHVSASVGISLFPTDASDSEELIKCADAAMYQSKELGRKTFQFYTAGKNTRTRELLLLENDLRKALARDQFVLYYQPLIETASGRIVGVEALIRWSHPARGIISPAEFIPLAEETGLILAIGEWVLEAACRQVGEWRSQGFAPVRMNVNLSPGQLHQPDLVQKIAEILRRHELDPAQLELEINEDTATSKMEKSIHTMDVLSRLGVRLAIGNFGVGCSRLGELQKFPISTLKIDQSLIGDITDTPNGALIAASVIALGHALNLEVVAGGVERKEQLELLRREKCDQYQGFIFSRPLPAAEVSLLLPRNE